MPEYEKETISEEKNGIDKMSSYGDKTMRKISAMYQWSGGTDYRHTCYECKNCKKIKKGSRTVYKCLSYGDTSSVATDWKASYIACKAFNQTPPEIPVIKLGATKTQEPELPDGQLSLFDFPEVMPGSELF